MDILDAIKSSVLKQFDTSLAVEDVLFSLLAAFLISLLIVFVYKKTFSGVVYSRSITMTIILICLATSMIIRTINSNLSLSLGMVGALSIVRFRTAVKDPTDTAFLFWSVTAGIMSGAGLYLIAVVGSLGIALVYYIAFLINVKSKVQYLMIVAYDPKLEEQVNESLGLLPKKTLKSKSFNDKITEITYQVPYTSDVDAVMEDLKNVVKVKSVNLVAYSNDFGM